MRLTVCTYSNFKHNVYLINRIYLTGTHHQDPDNFSNSRVFLLRDNVVADFSVVLHFGMLHGTGPRF